MCQALAARHGARPRPTAPPSTVLDALVRTILSQNTTDVTSLRAFQSLKRSFPTYRRVLEVTPPAAPPPLSLFVPCFRVGLGPPFGDREVRDPP